MTTGVHQLVVSLVDDLFGVICAKTIATMLSNTRLNMHDLISKTGFDKRTVNQCLCVLIKHRFVRYEESGDKKQTVWYSVDLSHSLTLPFYPVFVNIAKQQHGDVAEILLEELLHQGSTSRDILLETCMTRIKATIKDQNSVDDDKLNSIFEVLVSRGYIEKTDDLSESGEPPPKKI